MGSSCPHRGSPRIHCASGTVRGAPAAACGTTEICGVTALLRTCGAAPVRAATRGDGGARGASRISAGAAGACSASGVELLPALSSTELLARAALLLTLGSEGLLSRTGGCPVERFSVGRSVGGRSVGSLVRGVAAACALESLVFARGCSLELVSRGVCRAVSRCVVSRGEAIAAAVVPAADPAADSVAVHPVAARLSRERVVSA